MCVGTDWYVGELPNNWSWRRFKYEIPKERIRIGRVVGRSDTSASNKTKNRKKGRRR